MKFKSNAVLTLTLILALALPSMAQHQKKMMKGEMNRIELKEALNLTDEQESQMQDLRFDHEKAMIDLKGNIKKEQLELKKLKRADDPNLKKINAQIEKVGDARVAVEKAKASHQLAIRKILTEDQYKIFRNNMGRNGDRGHGRKDRCFRK